MDAVYSGSSLAPLLSWSGNITQNIYFSNCTDAAFVGVDTTTSLVALGNSALCETDITGGSTMFSKIEVSCDHITESEHPVVMTGYMCTDSACSNCSDTVSFNGWSPVEDFTTMAGTTNTPDTCLSYNTVSIDAGAIWDSMLSASSPSYIKYTSSPEIVATYTDVFIANSCLVDYAKTAEIEEGVHTEAGGSSSASVWGLSLSISAAAGLGAAILSL